MKFKKKKSHAARVSPKISELSQSLLCNSHHTTTELTPAQTPTKSTTTTTTTTTTTSSDFLQAERWFGSTPGKEEELQRPN